MTVTLARVAVSTPQPAVSACPSRYSSPAREIGLASRRIQRAGFPAAARKPPLDRPGRGRTAASNSDAREQAARTDSTGPAPPPSTPPGGRRKEGRRDPTHTALTFKLALIFPSTHKPNAVPNNALSKLPTPDPTHRQTTGWAAVVVGESSQHYFAADYPALRFESYQRIHLATQSTGTQYIHSPSMP